MSTLYLKKHTVLKLSSYSDVIRNDVDVIEYTHPLNFNNPFGTGTYYYHKLRCAIIFVQKSDIITL